MKNLMILESNINRSIGNYDFSQKKNKYKDSKYEVVKAITSFENWTKEDAAKRREESVKKILEYIYPGL